MGETESGALNVEVVTREDVFVSGNRKSVFEITSIYEPDHERMKAAVEVLLNSKTTN